MRELLPDDFNDNLSVEDIIPSLAQQTSPALLAQKLAFSQLQEEQKLQLSRERETELRLREVLRDDDEDTEQASETRVLDEVVLQGRPRMRPLADAAVAALED